MESIITVKSTPQIMLQAFSNENPIYSIRAMQAQTDIDPEPLLTDSQWQRKYGNEKHIYKVKIRYLNEIKPLSEHHTYSSWKVVENAISPKSKALIKRHFLHFIKD